MAERLQIDDSAYRELESGTSEAEIWGPRLAQLAITLEVPTSRLLAETGRSQDVEAGGPARLISQFRQGQNKSVEEMAAVVGLGVEEYSAVEGGESPLEDVGRRLLAFAEAIEQPVFNLFYPCGLPFQELDDYP